MITLTDKAAEKVQEIALADELTGQPLRVKVLGGGCAGFQYDVFFEDLPPTEMDETFESHGVTIIVDQFSLQYIDGTEIEYIDNGLSAGFKFLNPNVKASCGCGSSFSA